MHASTQELLDTLKELAEQDDGRDGASEVMFAVYGIDTAHPDEAPFDTALHRWVKEGCPDAAEGES